MRKYFRMKRMNLNKNESDLFIKLIYKIIDQKQSGEKSIGYLLDYGINSKNPIEEILEKNKKIFQKKKNKKKIFFIYGEKDWMDGKKAVCTIKNKKFFFCDIFFVKDSGHQLIFQNPKDVAEIILKFS